MGQGAGAGLRMLDEAVDVEERAVVLEVANVVSLNLTL